MAVSIATFDTVVRSSQVMSARSLQIEDATNGMEWNAHRTMKSAAYNSYKRSWIMDTEYCTQAFFLRSVKRLHRPRTYVPLLHNIPDFESYACCISGSLLDEIATLRGGGVWAGVGCLAGA